MGSTFMPIDKTVVTQTVFLILDLGCHIKRVIVSSLVTSLFEVLLSAYTSAVPQRVSGARTFPKSFQLLSLPSSSHCGFWWPLATGYGMNELFSSCLIVRACVKCFPVTISFNPHNPMR